MLYLYLAAGGIAGTFARYWATAWVGKALPSQLALGTLAVNILGSLAIGVFFVLIHDKMQVPEQYKPLLITGFLGSFTTFSSFSLETVNHLMAGQYLQAAGYVVLSVVLCLLFCWLGMIVARGIF